MMQTLPIQFFKKFKKSFEELEGILHRNPTIEEMKQEIGKVPYYTEKMELAYQYMTEADEIGEEEDFKIEIVQYVQNHELKKARIRKGYTQKDLNQAIGASSQTINNIENFKRMPNKEEIEKLSGVLGLDAAKLFPEWTRALVEANQKRRTKMIVEVGRLALDSPSILEIEAPEENQKQIDNEMLRSILEPYIEELSAREKKILEMRFGLTDGVSHTLEEVGQEFGVTRDRIRQIEAKALNNLKIKLDFDEKEKIKDFLYD